MIDELLDQSRLKNFGAYLKSRRKSALSVAVYGARDPATGKVALTLPSGGTIKSDVISNGSTAQGTAVGATLRGTVNDRRRTQ